MLCEILRHTDFKVLDVVRRIARQNRLPARPTHLPETDVCAQVNERGRRRDRGGDDGEGQGEGGKLQVKAISGIYILREVKQLCR